jgi:hypothetical protein
VALASGHRKPQQTAGRALLGWGSCLCACSGAERGLSRVAGDAPPWLCACEDVDHLLGRLPLADQPLTGPLQPFQFVPFHAHDNEGMVVEA